MNTKQAIGFVGLGIMGKPMARNLLKAGFPLSVYNRTPEKMRELEDEGAYACSDYAELAGRSAVIITILPDSPEVKEVVLGENGLFPYLREGMTVIDMSSIDPLVSIEIGKRLAEKGVRFLDAPVSGGETGAIEGTLAIMVGAEPDDFERCLPIFQAMGKNIVHVGPVGSGGFTKLVNQIIVALNIAAVGEAFTLAQKAGLDVERVFQAIRGGLAGSTVLDSKAPMIFSRNFQPGFKIRLHRKDLKNALETAKGLQVPLPLTALLQQFLVSLETKGKGELDHGALALVFEELAGVKIEKKPED